MGAQQRQERAAEWFRDLFESDITRLILSTLIILSVLPWVVDYSLVFFAIFATELYGRFVVLRSDLRRRSLNRVEVLFFAIDVLATLSFLPIEVLWDDIRFLRLFRLSRMLLLLGYWGPVVREIWTILAKRERRYQISFVLATVVILSFLAAIVLFHFHDDPKLKHEHFWDILWWSFMQIEDPGNMAAEPRASLKFFFSVFLTITGLFVFSFLIGIASSVVEELVRVGRERRIGMRRHSVICDIGPYSRVLLEELVTYYAKALRSPKIVTMGPAETRYSYMYEDPLHRIRYRHGQPLSTHDLQKVDADRATRVILLASRSREHSDSALISQILSAREVNPRASIIAELYRRDNVRAALEAGGPGTVPILADQLVSLFLAKILTFPGVSELYEELLTSRGDEIYTCIYDQGAMAGRTPPSGPLPPFGELLERAHRAHGVILLGHMLRDADDPSGVAHSLNPGTPMAGGEAPRPAVPEPGDLRGFFGVGANFQQLRHVVDSLPDVAPPPRQRGGEPARVPRMGVCPAASSVDNILVCGFHDGLVDFCEQLVLFTDELTVHIMVPDRDSARGAVQAFIDWDDDSRAALCAPTRVRFERASEHQVRYRVQRAPDDPTELSSGSIHVFAGDWSNERTLVECRDAGYELAAMDAVLFTYTPHQGDPDARTALGLLKLMHLREQQPDAIKPGLRIVCEVLNTDKAKLLQRRFGSWTADGELRGTCHPVTIVPAERMRNAVMAQAVFVPGIATIYRELLGEAGHEVCKLLLDEEVDPEVRLTFGQLLTTLYARDGLLAIGVELHDPDEGRRLVVNPRPRSEDYRFTAGEVAAVFAIGEYTALRRAGRPCPRCCTWTPDPPPDDGELDTPV